MIVPPNIPTRLAHEGVRYAPQIARAAARHHLDPSLLAAVAAQETGGPGSNAGSNIVGDGGHGRGLFQIDDRWHAFAKSTAAMNPAANADYAARMLSGLLRRYGGNLTEALSAYNAGDPHAQGTTTRWGDGQVLGYADSVLRHYRAIAAGSPPTQPQTSTLDACIAERASDAASVAPLAQQAMCLPPVPPVVTAANASAGSSWRRTEGLDATGHSQSSQKSVADLIAGSSEGTSND
ncbi:MAG: transglycosylase SLT domain-containing protein [Vulcanimicrobiaceae bacterium]